VRFPAAGLLSFSIATLTSLLSNGSPRIDRERHKADSPFKYKLYFELLHSKMQEHGIDVENTYNMDEQGFHVGVAKRGKGVFSKASLGPKAAVQDGNREWLTLLACVCASGESLPPVLVYQGTSGIQSGWVDAIEVGKHKIFFSNSESGWSNNDIDLAWLEQVFERFTKQKARRSYRLFILDGHGSHLTTEFIYFCDSNRILLAIFPPHSTHSLQPLDVVLFGSFGKASAKLASVLHVADKSQKSSKNFARGGAREVRGWCGLSPAGLLPEVSARCCCVRSSGDAIVTLRIIGLTPVSLLRVKSRVPGFLLADQVWLTAGYVNQLL
jgi:hypothetical protein